MRVFFIQFGEQYYVFYIKGQFKLWATNALDSYFKLPWVLIPCGACTLNHT